MAIQKHIRHALGIILLMLVLPLFSACEDQTAVQEPNGSTLGTVELSEQDLFLMAPNFPGVISLSPENITEQGDTFTLPVYLHKAKEEDIVDTISLKTVLPEGITLKEVITPSGFTAAIEGMGGSNPTVHFHSSAQTAGSYSVITAKDEPIFSIIYSGEPNGTMKVEGAFFRADGTLLKTNSGTLSLE